MELMEIAESVIDKKIQTHECKYESELNNNKSHGYSFQ